MTEKLNKEEKNLFMLQAVITSVLRAYNDDGTLKTITINILFYRT